MRVEKVWEGTFPSYWDITSWAMLFKRYVVTLSKDEDLKRNLTINDLTNKHVKVLKTYFNVIIGTISNNIILAKVDDARSHINLSRLSSLEIETMKLKWTNKKNILVEKYKIPKPFSINVTKTFIDFGKYSINLDNGAELLKNPLIPYIPTSLNHGLIQNKNKMLFCDSYGKVIWQSDNLHVSSYQGTLKGMLVFMTSKDKVLLLSEQDGTLQHKVQMNNKKNISGQMGGPFNFKNNNQQNTTIYDALIDKEVLLWINNDNNICIFNFFEKKLKTINLGFKEFDLCLSMIQHDLVLITGVLNGKKGILLVLHLED